MAPLGSSILNALVANLLAYPILSRPRCGCGNTFGRLQLYIGSSRQYPAPGIPALARNPGEDLQRNQHCHEWIPISGIAPVHIHLLNTSEILEVSPPQ